MTRLFINRFTGAVTATPNGSTIQNIAAKRGTDWMREVYFTDNAGAVVRLDAAATGKIVLRERDDAGKLADGDPVAVVDWTKPATKENAYAVKVPIYGTKFDALKFDEHDGKFPLVLVVVWKDELGTHESADVSFTIVPSVYATEFNKPEETQES